MSDKVRVYEIADEAGANSNEVISKAKEMGIELKSPQSAVSLEQAEEIVNYMMSGANSKKSNSSSKNKKSVSHKEKNKRDQLKIKKKNRLRKKKKLNLKKKLHKIMK